MLIRTQPTTLLEIFHKFMIYSVDIFINNTEADDTIMKQSSHEWVNSKTNSYLTFLYINPYAAGG